MGLTHSLSLQHTHTFSRINDDDEQKIKECVHEQSNKFKLDSDLHMMIVCRRVDFYWRKEKEEENYYCRVN